MRKAFALMSLVGLAGCANSQIAWNGPGWYLEKPHIIAFGRDYYGGPMTYDDCEIARKKETNAELLLCVNETVKPE